MHKIFLFLIVSFLAVLVNAQNVDKDSLFVRVNYIKSEVYIQMRDGKKLFTAIYSPKDQSKKYPVLYNRTPYTVSPYGENNYKKTLGNFPAEMYEGYIFVYQDVRGKWMSEGDFDDVRPMQNQPQKKVSDESTDAYDTLDWLEKNLKNYNKKAGIYGISYPGFYATNAAVNAHPTLKAVSPQAPVTNWFIGDDFHHNGVFMLTDSFRFMNIFGYPRPNPITPDKWPDRAIIPNISDYSFYQRSGTFSDLKNHYFKDSVKFWNDVQNHPNYDGFWQDRNPLKHIKNTNPAILVVGGFFDAEDAYGTFETYQAFKNQSPNNKVTMVVGPWFHGGWVRDDGSKFGDIFFDQPTSKVYQEKYELPFFNYYLKNKGQFSEETANVFFTGSNQWQSFSQWPPKNIAPLKLYLQPKGKLATSAVQHTDSWDEYVTDPNNPVPYQEKITVKRPREYMIGDQRFASFRPDVKVYQTDVLDDDLTIVGAVKNFLKVSSTGTDADYVVKLIDVYPENEPEKNGIIMGGYQMLVRAEIMAGRFREGFDKPLPLIPGMVTSIDYSMPDVAHTFKKGHRIMIQVQNSWFPLAERNTQQFIENPYRATSTDFKVEKQRIFHDVHNASYIELQVLK